MKAIYSLILALLLSLATKADTIPVNGLTIEANGMRGGDKLTRIDMKFMHQMTSDTLSAWDFSKTELLESETETFYNHVDTTTVVENENKENRMYRTDNTHIELQRHFRGGMDIKYPVPERQSYPILCGSAKFDKFFGEGQLGSMSYIKNAGFASLSANKAGDLITPDGDTIKNVMRVRYHRSGTTHIDTDFSRSFRESRDSSLFSNDSICHWLANDSVTHAIDKWQWYARGYRYPVVELRKYRTLLYGITCDSIQLAYYYPLSRQESEIENDALNEYYRENAADGYYMPRAATFGDGFGGGSTNGGNGGNNDGISSTIASSNFMCEVYPTVTTGNVTVRLYTDIKQEAACYLVSSAGVLLWSKNLSLNNGYNETVCPMEYLSSGIYFVLGTNGTDTVATKVIKTE